MNTNSEIVLLPHHRKQLLEESGITEETVVKAGICSITDVHKLRVLLNWRTMPARMAAGILFPFHNADGQSNGYYRFKPDAPRMDAKRGRPIKYESPREQPNKVYFPPKTVAALQDKSARILITEGEKKCLKADQEGFPCIGLVGVMGWKESRHERLLASLEAIDWPKREVIIAFDSDVRENELVDDALRRLASQLKNRGAIVKVAWLPGGPNGEKVGLDDFLVANGSPALHRILNESTEPENVDSGLSKVDSRSIDSMIEARRMLNATATHMELGEEVLKLRSYCGSWWWWTGTHYREEADSDIQAKTAQFLDASYCRLTQSALSNLSLCLRSETNVNSHKKMPTWLDGRSGDNWLPMKNGILNLTALLKSEADVIVPHTPRYFSSNYLPYDFDQNATCPKWLEFLDRNLEGDTERIALLQQFYGYCLTPTLTAQKFMFHEGEGANGKSVACAVLTAILGLENVSSVPLEVFGERFALYPTIGKLANIASEVGEIDRVAEGILKAYTTGDAIQFDRKHRDPITTRPTAKLVFASNARPRFTDKSGGLWRRMILMPWRVTIPEADRVRGMDKPQWWHDQGELPGILLWAIAGLWEFEKQGSFAKSSVCEAALAEYRAESNPARLFLQESFQFDPETLSPCADAYSSYAEWAKKNGFLPLAATSFGHEVLRAFPNVQRKQKTDCGERKTVYCGLKMR